MKEQFLSFCSRIYIRVFNLLSLLYWTRRRSHINLSSPDVATNYCILLPFLFPFSLSCLSPFSIRPFISLSLPLSFLLSHWSYGTRVHLSFPRWLYFIFPHGCSKDRIFYFLSLLLFLFSQKMLLQAFTNFLKFWSNGLLCFLCSAYLHFLNCPVFLPKFQPP